MSLEQYFHGKRGVFLSGPLFRSIKSHIFEEMQITEVELSSLELCLNVDVINIGFQFSMLFTFRCKFGSTMSVYIYWFVQVLSYCPQ